MTDTPTNIPAVTTELYNLLQPLDPAERKRIIKAALVLLGDDTSAADQKPGTRDAVDDNAPDDDLELNARARTWMSRNNVTAEQLAHVFHIDGETIDIIADTAPGKNQKEQTINAFVLTGIGEFLKTGEAKFTDKAAREMCKKMGCLSETNHSTYMKKPGNILSGSKSGWALTGPGLKAGAELIKGLIVE
jgi:hypothetical protein